MHLRTHRQPAARRPGSRGATTCATWSATSEGLGQARPSLGWPRL